MSISNAACKRFDRSMVSSLRVKTERAATWEDFDWHLTDRSLRSGMAVHGPDPRHSILALGPNLLVPLPKKK
jgi:hypothetical protein